MSAVYSMILGAGWGYIGHALHWPLGVWIAAMIMTVTFALFVSRVVEDDRQ